MAQLARQPSLTVPLPLHQVQGGTAYQFRLVRLHTIVALLSCIEVPPVHQVCAVARSGVCAQVGLNTTGPHALYRRRFFDLDELAVCQPGGDGLQPLAVTRSHGNKPLSVQHHPDTAILPIRLQFELWHQALPPKDRWR
jgi:hypothetical protein